MLTVLEAVLGAAAPQEGCALLLGRCEDAAWLLQGIWPCCNSWQAVQERHRRFAIDPREQVLGTAHSHPSSEPAPSATDRRLCVTPALMVICGGRGDCRAWWLPEGCERMAAAPRLVPWRMVD